MELLQSSQSDCDSKVGTEIPATQTHMTSLAAPLWTQRAHQVKWETGSRKMGSVRRDVRKLYHRLPPLLTMFFVDEDAIFGN